MPRLGWHWAALFAALAVFVVLGWQGITTVGRSGPIDAAEYLLNAQYLDAHGHLPPAFVSYEYSAPPLYEVVAVGLERIARAVPPLPLELGSNLAARLLWLLIVAGSAFCLTSRRPRVRIAGACGLALGLLWGFVAALSLTRSQTWSAGQLLALACAAGLVVVSALIAGEIWPGDARRMIGTAAFVLAYPVVLRLGVLFHPETTLAFLSALAVLLLLRAERRGWPLWLGIASGVACGLALLTRQSATVVVLSIAAGALLGGGRRAQRFTVGVVAAAALVGGPWLVYSTVAWGNPLQGNLQRPGAMVPGGEPVSFFVSFPIGSLVSHPYRDHLANQFLPQLHADLWSDWYGAFHRTWTVSSKADRASASSQSILGLLGDALALGGLAAFGVPALWRLVRRRARETTGGSPTDTALGLLALLAVAGVLGLLAQIIRYPQVDGKEIKASYLLFTAPCWAVFSVAVWVALWRRPALKVALVAAAALYVLSYGTSLAATFSHTYPSLPDVVVPEGYSDLRVSFQQTSPTPGPGGGEIDFAVWVRNRGTLTAIGVVLRIQLPKGTHLLGPPSFSRGSGCTGTVDVVCDLDFLPAGKSTRIGFGMSTVSGLSTITATVTGSGTDAHPADNSASLTMRIGSFS
jgi:4-amino-4-deoxy-L-arabinose transferase-like glycosyltransferase